MEASWKVLAMLVVTVAIFDSVCEAKCEFHGIFNFGASNVDTGGFSAAFPAVSAPNGMTYFKKPSGRVCDGRLIIDFLAQAFGFPFLSPYLQSVGSNYKHGANFATIGSTVLPNTGGISPFSLAIQLNQIFFLMKTCSWFFHVKHSDNLPSPDIFGKSLYNFYIGQNDFTSKLASIGISGVHQYLPQVNAQIVATIKEIYNMGGRTFLVLNLAPVGCYPAFIVQLPHNTSDLDEYGCMVPYNNAVAEYNKMLKDALAQTRKDLPDASIIYVDTHSVYLELFRHPKDHGLMYGPKACCGRCTMINGSKLPADACRDPYNYVSWDGIHATEAANKIITREIISGSYFDPPFSLSKHCDINPIG